MAGPPKDPDGPPSQPKYLPRLTYKPPEPEPDDEEAEEDGSPTAKPRKADKAAPSGKASSAPANPPRPGNPIRPGGPSTDRPKAKAGPVEDKTGGKTRAKSRSKDPGKAMGKDKAGVLIEETPEGETYDARRRVRLAVGAIATGIVILSLFVVYRTLRPDEPDAEPEAAAPAGAPVGPNYKPSPAAQEALARSLIDDARKFERDGKADEALKRVTRVADDFAGTSSATLAREARERHRQGLPLFVEGAAVIATKAETKPEPPPSGTDPESVPAPEVVAVVPNATPPPPGPNTVEVLPEAARPVHALAEPMRTTGVGLPKSDVAAKPLPPGFRAREEAGVHASGWPLEITCDRDGGAMVLVPADTFTQGRDDGKIEERPAHRVSLSTYYIDQHEITARQLALFRGGTDVGDDRPAVNVSLADARAYAQWAGKVIPTEAQWEMAARTPDGRLHPWGNARAEWDRTREPKQIDPVMSFPSDLSPYGVFDLAGNAWEWTSDWFDPKAYVSLKGKTVSNPPGPPRSKARIPEVVIKGGSKDWDASWRSGMRPDAKLPYLGFRCVLNVEGGGAVPQGEGVPQAPGTPAGTVPF